MPDKQTSIDKGLDNLDNQIADLVGKFIKRRKEHYEKAALKLHTQLKKDTKRYAALLADGKIKKDDFELLVRGRWAQLKIELLTETAVSKRKFEDIAGEVLKVTVNTVLDAV
jgi:outer membrane receptor for ferric coprogen and ferric-rhodotorulic acid